MFPPSAEVWIAAEIVLKKACLKPEHLLLGQIPKPGFGMDPFLGQLRLVRTSHQTLIQNEMLWGKVWCSDMENATQIQAAAWKRNFYTGPGRT